MTTPDINDLLKDAFAALGVTEVQPLRAGGQKWVFTAKLAGADCVVKIVHLAGPFADEARQRAHREVELLAGVDSQHVVGVMSDLVEVGSGPDVVCWVEERLTGDDLSTTLTVAPWPVADVERLIREVALGLAACHQQDVVHRDLSPGNVRRCDDDRFVLMDPGYARHLAKTALTGLYQPGTPGYMSPEHVPGGSPSPASDIFMLGVLAYAAVTGALPLQPTGDMDNYYRELRDIDVPRVQNARPDVPDGLAAVIDRCLNRQPARRYIDADELLAGLDGESTP